MCSLLLASLLVMQQTPIIAKDSEAQIRISVNAYQESVKEVLREIEKQSGMKFVYLTDQVDDDRKVTLQLKNVLLSNALETLFSGTSIAYEQRGKKILLKKIKSNDQSSTIDVLGDSYEIQVSGKVTDEDNQPLPGVNILVKGTLIGTTTDNTGQFTLTVPDENNILVVSFIGYASQEVLIGTQTEINIVLQPDITSLSEVVVVGYGTQKKSDVTGAVVRSNINDFKESPNTNVLQSMQGTVAGLNIGQVTTAGQSPSITIRGARTISGATGPLIVLDGVLFYGNLSELNPNDIQSIDVLKDASSTAIYGAQAANGVLLITTKKGTAGSPTINYSASYTSQQPAHVLKLLDRDGFIQKIKDIQWRTAYTPESGYTEANTGYDIIPDLADQSNIDGYNNDTDFDWWDAATNPGFIQNQQLSVSGATDKVKYFFSGGFTDQKNFVKNDRFKRVTTRLNLETFVTDWLQIGAQTYAAFSNYSGASPSLGSVTLAGPLRIPNEPDGDLIYQFESGAENPFVASAADDYHHQNSLFGNFYSIINFPFLEGLSYQINFGNTYRWNQHYYSNTYGASLTGSAFKKNDSEYDQLVDNIITYKKAAGDHNFDVTFVAGFNKRTYEYTSAEGNTFSNLLLSYNSLNQALVQKNFSNAWKEVLAYQMARVNYNFGGKYLITATVRKDGFSGFASNNKTALFPSVGLGWVASSESFLKKDWLTLLKLRASYGVNGNLVNRYSSLAQVSAGGSYVFGDGGSTLIGQQPTTMANNNLKWEKTIGLNLALDFEIDSRLSGSIDYYNTTTHDLLFSVNIPTSTGFSQVISNVGEIKNKGIEVRLSGTLLKKGDLQWDATAIVARNTNKITKLVGLDSNGDGKEDDLVSSGLFIGRSIGAIYDYERNGFWQLGETIPSGYSEGTEKLVDQSEDGLITADKDRVILGKTEPAYRFSVQNDLSYKGFSMMVFINSIQGGKDGYLGANDPWSSLSVQSSVNARRHGFFKGVNYWTPSNPNAEYRVPGASGAIKPGIYKDRSFVRLQDVSLGYTFTNGVISKWGLKNLKLYVSGKNLATWTKWKGWDPETGQGYSLNGMPVMRSYSIGLNVTL